MCDTIELTQYAHLHLLCGLVGKGHSQDVAIALWVFHKQADVFGGKRKGLSTASTCFID